MSTDYCIYAIYERHNKRIEYLQSMKGVKNKSVFKRKRNHVKLDDSQIDEIKTKFLNGASNRELAREYSITTIRVRKICSVLENYKTIAQSWINRGHRKKVAD